MGIMRTAKSPIGPEVVARHPYKELVIEVWIYKEEKGRCRAWPYIEKTSDDGVTQIVIKRHFPFTNISYFAVQAAVEAAVKEGKKQIDAGFNVEQAA